MNVGGVDVLFVLFFAVVFVGGFVLWVWTLVDAIRVPDDSMYRAGNKLVWVLVIVFGGIIGSVIYLAVGRPATSPVTPARAIPPPPPPSGWDSQ